MKLKIGDYEVEIKARYEMLCEKANDEDTLAFLCTVANWAWSADAEARADGFEATADYNRKAANDIHNFLESKGYVKGLQVSAKEGVGDVEMS